MGNYWERLAVQQEIDKVSAQIAELETVLNDHMNRQQIQERVNQLKNHKNRLDEKLAGL